MTDQERRAHMEIAAFQVEYQIARTVHKLSPQEAAATAKTNAAMAVYGEE